MTTKPWAGTLTVFGLLLILVCAGAFAQSVDPSKEWPTYGHDSGGMRFSPLTQITPVNVSQLKVAWVYHMKPAGMATPPQGRRGGVGVGDEPPPAAPVPGGRGRGRGGSGFYPSESTPLVVDGTLYMSTPYSRVVALDPTTGKEIWAFPLPSGSPSTRGIEYWAGAEQTPPQVVFGSSDGKLYSLNA